MRLRSEYELPAWCRLGEAEERERPPAPVVASFLPCPCCGLRHDRRLSCSAASDSAPHRMPPLAFVATTKARQVLGTEICDALIRGERPSIVCEARFRLSPGDVIDVSPHVSVCVVGVKSDGRTLQVSYSVRDFRKAEK
jgi:hypothetical protein